MCSLKNKALPFKFSLYFILKKKRYMVFVIFCFFFQNYMWIFGFHYLCFVNSASFSDVHCMSLKKKLFSTAFNINILIRGFEPKCIPLLTGLLIWPWTTNTATVIYRSHCLQVVCSVGIVLLTFCSFLYIHHQCPICEPLIHYE